MLSTGSHAYDAENKIAKVDNVSAYVYDGEGQRVRKLVGENLRFVYSIGGQLIAEFSGSSGALQKEYIYGASGLLATIEPTAVNSNGTRYTTPDHLGTPRVVTNSGATVISRHDYKPFGEELNAGVGGRTTGLGFTGTSDGLRQKFTQKERDNETGLDYFGARYYANSQGRFTSIDPLDPVLGKQGATDGQQAEKQFSAYLAQPQRWNRYAYCLDNPLRHVDPDGFDPLTVNLNIVFDKGQYTDYQRSNSEIHTSLSCNRTSLMRILSSTSHTLKVQQRTRQTIPNIK